MIVTKHEIPCPQGQMGRETVKSAYDSSICLSAIPRTSFGYVLLRHLNKPEDTRGVADACQSNYRE